jgi:hypothetical protein
MMDWNVLSPHLLETHGLPASTLHLEDRHVFRRDYWPALRALGAHTDLAGFSWWPSSKLPCHHNGCAANLVELIALKHRNQAYRTRPRLQIVERLSTPTPLSRWPLFRSQGIDNLHFVVRRGIIRDGSAATTISMDRQIPSRRPGRMARRRSHDLQHPMFGR